MRREEEIRNASIKYTLKNKPKFICGDMEDELYRNSAFEEGAEWADSHPVNVWHDANTMPSDSKSIIYLTKNGKFGVISQVHSNKWDWYVAVKYSIIKWTYVDDLLPKGGE